MQPSVAQLVKQITVSKLPTDAVDGVVIQP
jgi:hypothetical protein